MCVAEINKRKKENCENKRRNIKFLFKKCRKWRICMVAYNVVEKVSGGSNYREALADPGGGAIRPCPPYRGLRGGACPPWMAETA